MFLNIHNCIILIIYKKPYYVFRFKEAESKFLEALERIKQIKQPIIADKWESLYNNLGHVYRKLQNYEKALEYHKQVIM